MRVIQVGLGGMGDTWINAVQASTQVEYAGFVEINPQTAQLQAERYHLDATRIFRTLPEALAHVEADGVIDVSPPQFHKEISLAALNAGIPVLSEKPLASTFEDALAIVAAATEMGVLHMVAQNYRYRPQVQTIKKLMDSGEMGALSAVTVDFYKGVRFDGFRAEMAYPLIVDMSIHHFDLLRFFTSSEAVSIAGRSWNPPWSWMKGDASASVSLELSNGARVSYNGSWVSPAFETPWNGNWRFECANGVILLQDDRVWRQMFDGFKVIDGFTDVKTFDAEEIELIAASEALYAAQAYLLEEFYTAVTAGKLPATTAQDNIKSLALIFDIIRAFETGGVIFPTKI